MDGIEERPANRVRPWSRADSLGAAPWVNSAESRAKSATWKRDHYRGEMASGRSREASARQIARAGKPQAQDARATKKARPDTKSKKTVELIYG